MRRTTIAAGLFGILVVVAVLAPPLQSVLASTGPRTLLPAPAPTHLTAPQAPAASRWFDTTSVNPGDGESEFRAVTAISPSDIWAVGDYQTKAQYTPNALAEHWDGVHWSNVAIPSGGSYNQLNAVSADASNDVWAVGDYYSPTDSRGETLIDHWDGSQWTRTPGANVALAQDTVLYGVAAVAPDDVWAVGWSYDGTDTEVIEHWDGVQWSLVPGAIPHSTTSNSSLSAITAISSDDVWAVGGDIEHWDGTKWSIAPSSMPSFGGLASVSARNDNDIWVAGATYDASVDALKTLIEHWDGTHWSVISSPFVANGFGRFYGIAVAPDGTAYVAGSEGECACSGSTGLIERWDGQKWQVQTIHSLGNYYFFYGVIAFSGSHAWVVGFNDLNGSYQTVAEQSGSVALGFL